MSELKTTPEVCGMGHSMKRKEDAVSYTHLTLPTNTVV